MTMSVSEIVRECHQGFQSPKVIEERLRDSNKRQCYLAVPDSREEVLSYVTVKGAVKHTIVPNPSAKICFVSLTEASDVMERMIISNDDCVYPVSVPVSPHRNDTSDDNNNSLEDIGVVSQTGSI